MKTLIFLKASGIKTIAAKAVILHALFAVGPVHLLKSPASMHKISNFSYFNPTETTGGALNGSHPGVMVATPGLGHGSGVVSVTLNIAGALSVGAVH